VAPAILYHPDLISGHVDRISDFEIELVDDFDHWMVEKRPEPVHHRDRTLIATEPKLLRRF
jgi:hypothetical protein